MFKLTLRELLLLAATVGVSLGWWIQRVEYRRQIRDYRSVVNDHLRYLTQLGIEFDPDNPE
jgi:hypothetical protein